MCNLKIRKASLSSRIFSKRGVSGHIGNGGIYAIQEHPIARHGMAKFYLAEVTVAESMSSSSSGE